MNDIFSSVSVQTLSLAFAAILIWNIFLTFRVLKFWKKSNMKFPSGISSAEVQEILLKQSDSIEKIKRDLEKMNSYAEESRGIALKGIQNVGVVRFNPFKGVGGDQSFAIALLDSSGSGITISSLYGREGARIYAKPVKNKTSPYQFSDEEREAIEGAMGANG